jgi:drug/metabolite transporter (DMT)-like permease
MPANAPLLGELACLSAALLWAVSIQLFRNAINRHGARAANLFKCVFAATLLAVTVLATGSWRAFWVASPRDVGLVAVSGLLGLTLGDTALFSAVARLGAHRGLLLQTLAPVFATAIAIPLGERLDAAQWIGSGVVLAGVMIVLSRDDGRSGRPAVGIAAGVALGVLSAFGQGTGVVVAKAGMTALPILPATLLRLAVGAGGLAAVGAVTGTLGRAAAAVRDRRGLPRLALASFFGTYLAMLLMMAGIAWAQASIAAVLLATPPVFGLVVESVLERRLPSARGVLGTSIAIAGVAVLVAG